MFATPFASRTPAYRAQGSLYQQIGVETRLAGASPHQLVAMLFDGYLEAVAQARGALRSRNSVAKGMAIGRAVRIIEEGLRPGLDMGAGGTLARDLNDLYGYLIVRLTVANLHSDEDVLLECQRLVQPLRDAWVSIAPAEQAR